MCCSFDVRGRPLAHALKWSSDVDSGGFGARAAFVVFAGGAGPSDNGNKAALRVANVSEQDAGPYRCRVDFRDSPTRNYRIILRVIGKTGFGCSRETRIERSRTIKTISIKFKRFY